MRRATLLPLLALACGPPPAPPAAPLEPDDFLLGGIPSHADSAEIRISFGDPDSIAVAPDPFQDGTLSVWHYPGFEVRLRGAVPLAYLLFERGLETGRGMQVGDAVDELRRRYGEPDVRADSSWTYIEPQPDDHVRVLDFVVRSDTIRRIYIGPVP